MSTFDKKTIRKVLDRERQFIDEVFSKMPLPMNEVVSARESTTQGKKMTLSVKNKPVFNSEGHMVFSKFDFSEAGTKQRPKKFERNPVKALKRLKMGKQKLKDLAACGDEEKAQAIQEKETWRTILAKANGEKVKNDPELLKRTIKRNEQKKKRSAKKWEARIAGVEKTKQDRQKKRQENIMKRKKEKKLNKLKKASKKGRIIPGL